jgi:hypothetical protein
MEFSQEVVVSPIDAGMGRYAMKRVLHCLLIIALAMFCQNIVALPSKLIFIISHIKVLGEYSEAQMVIRGDGQQQNSLSAETYSELFSQLNDGTILRLQFAVCLHIFLLRYQGVNKIHMIVHYICFPPPLKF